jgi:heptosyltransferase-2
VVLSGAESEREICRRIAGDAGLPEDDVVAGELSLPEVLALISLAGRVVTNDSAPLHLAESVGTPVTALFGPTVPEFGFAPRGPASGVVELQGLPCRPCGIHGAVGCPIGTHACMVGIGVDRVLDSILSR